MALLEFTFNPCHTQLSWDSKWLITQLEYTANAWATYNEAR